MIYTQCLAINQEFDSTNLVSMGSKAPLTVNQVNTPLDIDIVRLIRKHDGLCVFAVVVFSWQITETLMPRM